MKATMLAKCVLATCLLTSLITAGSPRETESASSWNRKAAAGYLDQREGWWAAWPTAARDHQTFCVSCHTALPYALSRPALRAALAEGAPSVNEQRLLDNVTKRVRLWKEVEPFYKDEKYGANKAIESRGTEAVLNALILASYDARHRKLSAAARDAFNNMWALELSAGDDKGAWPWLKFDNEPWEANDSEFYGACLAAIAVGTAPENYSSTPQVQKNLKLLAEYLNRESGKQSPINRIVLLWASAKLPGLLAPELQRSFIIEALCKQRADGGWSLSSLVGPWKRRDGTPLDEKSDGYASGLVALALQQAGISRENVQLERGLAWLARNQNPTEGNWIGYSLNKQRDLSSYTGRFMSDAATAYAVLALSETH